MKSFVIGVIVAIVVAGGIVYLYSWGSISQVQKYAGDVVHVGTDQQSREGAGTHADGADNPDRAAMVD